MARPSGIDGIVVREFSRPFEYGESDCCLSVANVLVALGRADPAASWRGQWKDEADAVAITRGDLETIIPREAARLGWPEIDPGTAKPGDIGLSLGVLLIRTENAWAAKSEKGVVVMRRAQRAWRTA